PPSRGDPRCNRARLDGNGARPPPRPPRERAAQPPVADGGELGGVPAPPPAAGAAPARRRVRAGQPHLRAGRPGGAGHGHRPGRRPRRARGGGGRAHGPGHGQRHFRGRRRLRGALRRRTLRRRPRPPGAAAPHRPGGGAAGAAAGCPPGGVGGARDGDYAAMTWYPADPRLDRWLELYHEVTNRNGGEADAGRYLLAWAREAGFGSVDVSTSTWTFADPETRAWWGGLWADRVSDPGSGLAAQAVAYGLATTDELADLAEGWRAGSAQEDGYFAVVH